MRLLIAAVTVLLLGGPAQANMALESSAPVRTIVRVDASARGRASTAPTWALLRVGEATFGIGDDKDVPLRPYPPGSDLPDNRHGVHLVAVLTARVAAFHKAVEAEVARSTPKGKTPVPANSIQGRLNALRAVQTVVAKNPRWCAMTTTPLGGRKRRVATDPTHVIREHYRITGLAAGTVHVKQISRRLFDAAGKEITPVEAKQKKASANRLLLGLAFLGLLGLFGVVIRRLRATPSREHAPTPT